MVIKNKAGKQLKAGEQKLLKEGAWAASTVAVVQLKMVGGTSS